MSSRHEKVIDRFCAGEAPVVTGVLQVCRDRLRIGKSLSRRGRSVHRGAVELLLQLGVGGRLKPDEKPLVHRSISPRALSRFQSRSIWPCRLWSRLEGQQINDDGFAA